MSTCSGGAALSYPWDGGAYFEQMLAYVPDTARYVISNVCGIGIYTYIYIYMISKTN